MTIPVPNNVESPLAETFDLEEEKPMGADRDLLAAYPDRGTVRKSPQLLPPINPKTRAAI